MNGVSRSRFCLFDFSERKARRFIMSKLIDLVGQRFGKLTIIEKSENKGGKTAWLCKCDCGNSTVVVGGNLKNGHTTSCGCNKDEYYLNAPFKDLTGMRFGKLTVQKRVENKGGNVCWLCLCDCGESSVVTRQHLVCGHTKTCGKCEKGKKWIGKKFGKLTLIKKADNDISCSKYVCKCDCGNEIVESFYRLKNNSITSCGCDGNTQNRYQTKGYLIKALKNYVEKNGYPTNKRGIFKPENNLPSYSTYERAFGKNLVDWLEQCGYSLTEEEKYRIEGNKQSQDMTKSECISRIYKMMDKLGRNLTYDDFRNPTVDTLGITVIKRYFGSLNKMKKELGLEITQEYTRDKILTKEQFDNEVQLILEYLGNQNISSITTRQISKLPFCSNYGTLHRDCVQYYQKSLSDLLEENGISIGERGKGLTYKFEDGEFTTSQFEYLFSNYLRDFGLKYGEEYFRDVKYSEFIPNYTGNMNCDYVVKFQGRTIYIEIAGLLDSYKTWYYKNKPIERSESKEKYRLKLAEKQQLLESVNAEYFILFPCDLTKDIFNAILMTDDSVKLRENIQNLN